MFILSVSFSSILTGHYLPALRPTALISQNHHTGTDKQKFMYLSDSDSFPYVGVRGTTTLS